MFKNIYTKFVVIYISLLILIILLLSGFSMMFFYKQHTDEAKVESMKMSEKISDQLTNYYNNDITKKELVAWIDAMSFTSNTKIYVLNPDKTVINNIEDKESVFTNENIIKDISKVMDGETIIKIGLLGNKDNNNIMYLGTPYIYNNEIVAIILLFTPVEQFVNTIETMIYGIISISIIITAIASIIILIISKNISEPIITISKYARKIGKGEEVKDITVKGRDEISDLAKSFNEMKKEIYAAENIRKEFVANVSHELRTPLTTIIGFLKGIIDGIIPKEEENKYIEIVYNEANRLKDLTTDILDITKMEAGKIKLKKIRFNLSHLLNDICIEFENEIKNKGLVMLTEYKKNLVIEADKDRLKQVIINIISNSLKFTQKGYIKLSARVQRGKLLIIIEDSGSGIPKEKIPHIFDKFYTANEYGSATGGAGLGLNIAQTIVKLHDGNIKVDSEIGVGTTITIEL